MKKIEKILKYIESQRLTNTAFEQKSGVSNGYLRNIAKTNSEISGKMLNKMFAAYPELENYLENASTPPLSEGEQLQYNKATKGRENKKVPLIGDAAASTDIEINTDQTYTEQYIDVGDLLRDSEAAFTVYGNSMAPAYSPGCILGLKRCYDKFIQPGEIYVIETDSNRLFKRLYWNEDKTGYVCISDNTMMHETGPRKGKYFYEPFEVSLDQVRRLFDVTGAIKRTRNSGIIQRVGTPTNS